MKVQQYRFARRHAHLLDALYDLLREADAKLEGKDEVLFVRATTEFLDMGNERAVALEVIVARD